MGVYYTNVGLQFLVANMVDLLTVVEFTGVTTNGSPTVSALSSQVGLEAGQLIVGAGIPTGTYILSVNAGPNTLTLSQNATATSTTGSPTTLWAFGNENGTIPLFEHLLTGTVPQGPNVTWADVVEANYDGYAPQQWATPIIVSAPNPNYVVASSDCLSWIPTDYNVQNLITGRAVTFTPPGASGPTLIATEPFQPAINLASPGQLLRDIPILPFPCDVTSGPTSPILP